MKKYFVGKKVIGFVVVLLICTIFISSFNNIIYKFSAEENNAEIKKMEQFIKEFSVIPKQTREFRNNEEDDFVLLNIPLSEDLQKYTYKMCKKYGEDYIFIMSIMATESSFNIKAKCKNQTDNYMSIGLMQLNQRYKDEFVELTGKQDFDIFNPYDNIEGGVAKVHALRKLWSKYDMSDEDMFLAITNSYNKGYNKYKSEVISRGFFSRDYDKKVLKNKIKLEMDGGIE